MIINKKSKPKITPTFIKKVFVEDYDGCSCGNKNYKNFQLKKEFLICKVCGKKHGKPNMLFK
jgi:hypothetical protein